MSKRRRDRVRKTYSVGSRGMWCENCSEHSVSKETFYRVYASGREVRCDICEACGARQETESIKRHYCIENIK